VLFTTETIFKLSDDTYLEPDFTFYEANSGLKGLNGGNALLVLRSPISASPTIPAGRQRCTPPSVSASCG